MNYIEILYTLYKTKKSNIKNNKHVVNNLKLSEKDSSYLKSFHKVEPYLFRCKGLPFIQLIVHGCNYTLPYKFSVLVLRNYRTIPNYNYLQFSSKEHLIKYYLGTHIPSVVTHIEYTQSLYNLLIKNETDY